MNAFFLSSPVQGQRGVCETRDLTGRGSLGAWVPGLLGSYDQLCMPHAAKAWLHATKFTLPQKSGTMFRHCPLQFDYGQADGASGAGEGNNSKQQRRQTAKRAANSIKVPLHPLPFAFTPTLLLFALCPVHIHFAFSVVCFLNVSLKRKTRMKSLAL